MDRADLETLIERGLTIREIAGALGVSRASARYWIANHGLTTRRASRLAELRSLRRSGANRGVATCPHHGRSDVQIQASGAFRCLQCRSDAVSRRRRRVKEILVEEAGGRCVRCGYDRSLAALVFHHRDRSTKTFGIAGNGVTRSVGRAREEATKCDLLCANCHAEVEDERLGRLR